MTTINRLAIDLYQGNGVTDFRAVYAAGIRLVIHKASEGVTVRDRKYAERRSAARAAGLMWGAYHFGRGSDVGSQVSNFLRACNPDPETRLVLDWEVPEMTPASARAFLSAVDKEIGTPTILYSYSSFLREQLGGKADDFFGARPLWLAAYSRTPPIPQASWKKWFLWQYTDGESGPTPQVVSGITGAVDCNHFDGTEAELRAAWLGIDAAKPDVEPWNEPGFNVSVGYSAMWGRGGDPRTYWVQIALNKVAPSHLIPEDGLSGPLTANAVRSFERSRGLTLDAGIIGPQVIAALKAALAELND